MPETFTSLVYPIHGLIRFEIDNIQHFQGPRYSDFVKIGNSEWYLYVKEECSKSSSVYLSKIQKGKNIKVNHPFRLISEFRDDKIVECYSNFTKFHNSWGIPKFIEFSEFESDDKIIVECSIRIDSEEDDKIIDFLDQRPNEKDLRMILERNVDLGRRGRFEENVELDEILKAGGCSTDTIAFFGFPIKLTFEQTSDNWLAIKFHVNWQDTSDWWMANIAVEIRINDISQSFTHLFRKKSAIYEQPICEWEEFGPNFKVEYFVQLLENFKNPSGGIGKPMRNMTDAVITVDGEKLHVCKKLLTQKSSYFRDLFNSNPNETNFEIENFKLNDFLDFLEQVLNLEETQWFQIKNNSTDVGITVDGCTYLASKQVLANASYYFMKQFYGPTDSQNQSIICDLFELLLTHIYNPKSPVTSDNFDSLLQLAHQFSVFKLMEKCEKFLVLNDSVSLNDKLQYAGKFDLPYLKAACLKLEVPRHQNPTSSF